MDRFAVQKFRKVYRRSGKKLVVTVPDGRFQDQAAIWLRGPNGSGKTTLLRAIAGWIVEFDGVLECLGKGVRELWRDHAMSLFPAFEFLPRRKPFAVTTQLFARYAGLDSRRFATQVEHERLALAAEPCDGLQGDWSTGEERKLALALFFALDRPVKLLDEPFAGLDSDSVGRLAARMARAVELGSLLIFTDHHGSSSGRMDVARFDIAAMD